MNKLPTIEDVLREPATIDDAIHRLRELAVDFKAHPEDWENITVDQYLSSMAAWLESFRAKLGAHDWRAMITAVEAAKIYE